MSAICTTGELPIETRSIKETVSLIATRVGEFIGILWQPKPASQVMQEQATALLSADVKTAIERWTTLFTRAVHLNSRALMKSRSSIIEAMSILSQLQDTGSQLLVALAALDKTSVPVEPRTCDKVLYCVRHLENNIMALQGSLMVMDAEKQAA